MPRQYLRERIFLACKSCRGGLKILHLYSVQSKGTLIPPADTLAGLEVSPSVRFVLVIEKDAIFRGLSTSDFVNDEVLGQSIIITGKGFPDVVTRELVHNLAESLDDRSVRLQAKIRLAIHS